MDLKQVFLIYDGVGWTRERVKKELIEEKYRNYFAFGSDFEWVRAKKLMLESDEIWVFGGCEETDEYKYAIEQGMDVWIMG